jgi:hypothetical protein
LPKNSNKIFRFKKNENEENMKEWVDVINMNLFHSEGKKNNLTDLVRINKFWKVLFLVY